MSVANVLYASGAFVEGWIAAMLFLGWRALQGVDQRWPLLLAAGFAVNTLRLLLLAAGYGLDPAESFPALLQTKADQAGLNFNVVNAGLSGDTTAGGLRRIEWILKRPVNVLVLELGGNDGLRGIPVAETRTNLQGIIDKARKKYPQVQIIVAGMMMPPSIAIISGSINAV